MAALRRSCPRCQAQVTIEVSPGSDLVRCPNCSSLLPIADTPVGPGEPVTAVSPPQAAADNPSTACDPSSILFNVDDYEVQGEIARGGMGIVYRARQISVNRIVALKMVLAGNFASAEALQRFRKEAQATARLTHPHIVPIYDVGEYQGQPYFTMKLLEDGGLHRHLSSYREDPSAAAALTVTVARAVHYAHQRGILHRDLKPSNILLDLHGQPHVTDFGLAKRVFDSSSDEGPALPAEEGVATASGQVVGTPEYMSPEQASAQKTLTTAADVYGLGAVLYALLTGQPPARGSSFVETIRQVLDREPPPPRQVNPRVDRDLETIVLKCLQKDPAQRYGSAEELARELERWLNGESIQARRAGLAERVARWVKRRPAVAALLGLVVVVALIGSGAFFWQYNDALAARDEAQGKSQEATEHANRASSAAKAAEEASKAASRREEEANEARRTADRKAEELRRALYTSDLVRAGSLAEKNPEEGLAILENPERCPPQLRDFTWGLLYRLCKRDHYLLPEQSSTIEQLALSGDGKTLVTLDHQEKVQLWDSATGRERSLVPARLAVGTRLLLTRDGRTLITGSSKEPLHPAVRPVRVVGFGVNLWELTNEPKVEALWSARNPVTSLTVSANERYLAAASGSDTFVEAVKVWDLSGRKEVLSLGKFPGLVEALALSPDGKVLATASRIPRSAVGGSSGPAPSGKVQLWDVAGGKELRELKFSSPISALCFTPDGRTLLGASLGTVYSWDLAGEKVEPGEPFEPGIAPLSTLAVSPGGKMLAGGSYNGVTLWNVGTGKVHIQFRQGRPQLAFLDENALVASSADGTVRRWEINLPVEREPDIFTARPQAYARHGTWSSSGFTPDGKLEALRCQEVTARLRDALNGKELALLTGLRDVRDDRGGSPPALKPEIQLSLDGKNLALVINETLKLCDARTGRERLHLNGVRHCWFSPDGKYSAIEVGKFTPTKWSDSPEFSPEHLHVWDVERGAVVARIAGMRGPVIFSVDAQLLAAVVDERDAERGGVVHSVVVHEVATGRKRLEAAGFGAPVAFTPDSKGLLLQPTDYWIRHSLILWDLAGGKERFTLAGTRTPVAWALGGKLLAAAGAEPAPAIPLWDVSTGKRLAPLLGHTERVSALAVSPDGKTLASAGEDRTVRLWDLTTGLERACLHGPTGSVSALRFTPDGKTLIAKVTDGKHLLWDVASGRQHVFRKGSAPFSAVALSPDGKRLATACGPDVHLWDEAGQKPTALEGPGGVVTGLAFSADGKVLTARSAVARKRWDTTTGKVAAVESLDAEPVPGRTLPLALPVSSDGLSLIKLEGRTLVLRDLRSGEPRGTIRQVCRLPVFSPAGGVCAAEVAEPGPNGLREALVLWDSQTGKEIATLADVRGPALFSPDGRCVAALSLAAAKATKDGPPPEREASGVHVWEARTGKRLATLEGLSDPVAFAADGRWLLARQKDGALAACSLGEGAKPVPLQGAALPAVAVSGGRVLSASEKGHALRLWDTATGKELAVLEGHTGAVVALACSPDGSTAASIGTQETPLRLWDLTRKEQRPGPNLYPHFRTPETFTFTVDGLSVFVKPRSNPGMLYDARTGKPPSNPLSATYSALSLDGKWLLSSGQPPSVVEASTLRPRLALAPTVERIYGANYSFSADGKLIIMSSGRGVWVNDADTGEEVSSYDFTVSHYPPARVSSATDVEQKERYRLMTNAPNRSATLHDADTGQKLGTLTAPAVTPGGRPRPIRPAGQDVACMALSPDGKQLATTSSTPAHVQVWDTASGVLQVALPCYDPALGAQGRCFALAFAPDGKAVLAYGGQQSGPDFTVYHWDIATGKRRIIPLLRQPGGQPTGVAAFSPDARLVAISQFSQTEKPGEPGVYSVSVFDLEARQPRATLALPRGAFTTNLHFSPDGKLLACLTRNPNRLRLWDWAADKERLSVEVPAVTQPEPYPATGPPKLLAFTADGKLLGARFGADTVMLWDAATGKERAAVKGAAGSFALAPDGKTLAILDADSRLVLHDVTTGKERASLSLLTYRGYYSLPARMAFSADGQTVFVALPMLGGGVLAWEAVSGKTRLLGSPGTNSYVAAASPDGQLLALAPQIFGLRVGFVSLLDLRTGQERHVDLQLNGDISGLAFSPDGALLAIGSRQGRWVRLWDVKAGKLQADLKEQPSGVLSLAFNPDGKLLASGGLDGTVRVWEITTGKESASWKETGAVGRLAYTPDGKRLAAVIAPHLDVPTKKTIPGAVKIWDAAGKERLAAPGSFVALAVSPDGQTVAVATERKTIADGGFGRPDPDNPGVIKLFDVASGKEKATLAKAASWLWFAPDSKKLVLNQTDGTFLPPLTVWDLPTNKEQGTLPVSGGVMVPPGRRDSTILLHVARGTGGQRDVRAWDVATRREVYLFQAQPARASFSEHPAAINQWAVSPDGKVLATRCDVQVNLWDLPSLQARATLPGSNNSTRLAFSSDSKLLAVTSFTAGSLKVWDVASGQRKAGWSGIALRHDQPFLFSADGRFLAAMLMSPADQPDVIKVWDVLKGAEHASLTLPLGERAEQFHLCADGSTLAVRSGRRVRLWDVATGKERRTLSVPTSPAAVTAVEGVSADGAIGITRSADEDGNAEWTRWEVATGREQGTLAGQAQETLLAEAPALLTVSRDESLKLVEPTTGDARLVLRGVADLPHCGVFFSADGGRLVTRARPLHSPNQPPRPGKREPVTTDTRDTFQVWDRTSGRLVTTFRAWLSQNAPNPFRVEFSPDGRMIAFVGSEGTPAPDQPGTFLFHSDYTKRLLVWDTTSGQLLATLVHPDGVTSFVFSPGGKRLVSSCGKELRLWELPSGKLLRTFKPQANHIEVRGILLDDKVLLVQDNVQVDLKNAGQNVTDRVWGPLKLWDAEGDRELATLQGSSAPAWSRDGRTLATILDGYFVQVWDVETRQERATLGGHRTYIGNVRFTPDGAGLVAHSHNQGLRWMTATPDLAERHYWQGNSWTWRNHTLPSTQGSNFGFAGGEVNAQRLQNLGEAAGHYRRAVTVAPGHQRARLGLGRVLLEQAEHSPADDLKVRLRKEAVGVLRELVVAQARLVEGRYLLAEALFHTGAAEESLPHYRAALEMDRDHADALLGLVRALVDRGRVDEAIDACRRRLALRPEDGETQLVLARLLVRKGRSEEAAEVLKKAMRAPPGRVEVWAALGELYEKQNKPDEAIAAYREATSTPGQVPIEALVRLAWLLERRGQLGEAVRVHRRVVEIQSQVGRRHAELGRALLRNGQLVEAAAALRHAEPFNLYVSVSSFPHAAWLAEADRLAQLDRKWPKLGQADAKPTDAAGLLEWAALQRCKGRYLDATRLYQEAFAKQASLARGLDRYGAACAAILASAGFGEDTGQLTPDARQTLRRQALDWLRAELQVQRQAVESKGDAAQAAYQVVSLWQIDADLATVRDKPEITALPAAEQEEWRAFWSEVSELRQKADALPVPGWKVEDREIVQSLLVDGPCWLRLGDTSWGDYDFEVEALRVKGVDGFGVAVRVADREHHVMANVGGWGNRIHGVEVMTHAHLTSRPEHRNGTIEADRWYRVKFQVRGSSYKVFLDGEELLAFTDTNHPNGGVGLRSWSTINRFRNLKVTDPAGKVLFEGLPAALERSADR